MVCVSEWSRVAARGLKYKLEIGCAETQDQVFEKNGARVMLAPQSIMHLNGTEMDYKYDLMQAGFVFDSPTSEGSAAAVPLSVPERVRVRRCQPA